MGHTFKKKVAWGSGKNSGAARHRRDQSPESEGTSSEEVEMEAEGGQRGSGMPSTSAAAMSSRSPHHDSQTHRAGLVSSTPAGESDSSRPAHTRFTTTTNSTSPDPTTDDTTDTTTTGLFDFSTPPRDRPDAFYHSAIHAAYAVHRQVRDSAVRAYRLWEDAEALRALSEQNRQRERANEILRREAEERVRLRTLELQGLEIRRREEEEEEKQQKEREEKERLVVADREKVEDERREEQQRRQRQREEDKQTARKEREAAAAAAADKERLAVLEERRTINGAAVNGFMSKGLSATAQGVEAPNAALRLPQEGPTTGTSIGKAVPGTASQKNNAAISSIVHINGSTSNNAQTPPHQTLPFLDRYKQIHQTLKEFRRFVYPPKSPTDPQALNMRKKAGEIRRSIKMMVGQLVGGKGMNNSQLYKMRDLLREVRDTFPSPPMDPNTIIVRPRSPQEGAPNNGDTLPVLFVYALHILAKAMVSQFANECWVGFEKSDPVGIFGATIYANAEFGWRGRSLIDLWLCKMRIACPVAFGVRGDERTDAGRTAIGWARQPDGRWMGDVEHANRMTGLASGFAAVTLRDFSRVHNVNPCPPHHFWRSLASITATPAARMAPTQCTVLRAMLDGFMAKFISVYGRLAPIALRVAVVDFPARWPGPLNPHVEALKVLKDKLQLESGLRLVE